MCYVLCAAHGIITVSRKLRRPGTLKSISSPKLYRLGLKWVDLDPTTQWWVHLQAAPISVALILACCCAASYTRVLLKYASALAKRSRVKGWVGEYTSNE